MLFEIDDTEEAIARCLPSLDEIVSQGMIMTSPLSLLVRGGHA